MEKRKWQHGFLQSQDKNPSQFSDKCTCEYVSRIPLEKIFVVSRIFVQEVVSIISQKWKKSSIRSLSAQLEQPQRLCSRFSAVYENLKLLSKKLLYRTDRQSKSHISPSRPFQKESTPIIITHLSLSLSLSIVSPYSVLPCLSPFTLLSRRSDRNRAKE